MSTVIAVAAGWLALALVVGVGLGQIIRRADAADARQRHLRVIHAERKSTR